MPLYRSTQKDIIKFLKRYTTRPLITNDEETTQPTETFTYREPKLFFNLHFTARFLNNIQVSDYPRRFLSVNPTLPLELNSVSIIQNGSQVSLDEENSNYNIYPDKSFRQIVDDGDISVKWFMNGVEVVGETNASLTLDENNGDQGKNVYAEVTNNIDASVFTSNTITIQSFISEYHYYRFTFRNSVNNSSDRLSYKKFYFDGVNLIASSATASEIFSSSYSAIKAFDGNPSTRWSSKNGGVPATLEAYFSSKFVRPFNTVKADGFSTTQYSTDWKLEASNDGVSYDLIVDVTNQNILNGVSL